MPSKPKTNAFEHDGHWWDPAHPGERWSGILRFNEHEGGTLCIVVPTQSQASAPPTSRDVPDPSVIVGVTPTGTLVTLVECLQKSWSLNPHGLSHSVEIYANAVIQGFHCDQDPLLDTVSVSLSSLSEWWGRSGITVDSSAKSRSVAVHYASPGPIVVRDDGRFRVSLEPTFSVSHSRQGVSLHEDVRFAVRANEPSALSQFEDVLHACQDFLSIASMSRCSRMETWLRPPKRQGRREHGTYHAVPIYAAGERQSSFWLFRLADIQGDGSQPLAAWLSEAGRLRYVRALYFAGVYGGGFVEQKLLFLTQAAEAFHRLYYPGLYLEDQSEFEATVLKPLTEALPVSVDTRVRQAINAKLKFANEYSLRQRLRELVHAHAEILEVLVEKPEQWVQRIVDLRNEFTHFPVDDRKCGSESAERAELYNWLLRLLLEACFLRIVGFEPKQALACVAHCSMYQQISRRFTRAGP